MPAILCAITGCGRTGKIVRGLCDMHYSRWKRCRDPGGPEPIIGDTESRFWRQVDKSDISGCWLWKAHCSPKGYGQFFDGTRVVTAHSYALVRYTGLRPPGAVARHNCDNPPCVRPDHLLWGTPAENSQDMVDRGRSSRGSKARQAKLTERQVVEIRARYATGRTTANELAKEYGVTGGTIRPIIDGRTWKHVK